MIISKLILLSIFALSAPFALAACEKESEVEEAVEEVGDEIDDATTY